ncbi:hypothetical protein BKA63DRAFT_609071 [Paraphoma chrysanthemicola]|nr:hypothetical protein BKA63DRAFT_609071 [Paraphoma chrysanthemicola]
MSSLAHLNSSTHGATIVDGNLTCSCGLVMAGRPGHDPKFLRCPKAYKPDQCENKIWLNEEAEVRQKLPHVLRTPTSLKQRDIVSYFPETPTSNPGHHGSARMEKFSGDQPSARKADDYGPADLKRPSTPSPLARTLSKKTKVETALPATPESRPKSLARSKRSHTTYPNYITDSPCPKGHVRDQDSMENHGASAEVNGVHMARDRVTEAVCDENTGVVMRLGKRHIPITEGVRNFFREVNEALSLADGNKP